MIAVEREALVEAVFLLGASFAACVKSPYDGVQEVAKALEKVKDLLAKEPVKEPPK